jgi:hypothetical protein
VLYLHHSTIPITWASRIWIWQHVQYHHMTHREDLREGDQTIETCLTHLAMEGDVSPSTPNQAMHALVFLYRHCSAYPWTRICTRYGHGGRHKYP